MSVPPPRDGRLPEVKAAVVVAMDDEAAPFLERASHVGDPVAVGGAVERTLVVEGRTLLLVRSGIGLVNAATAVAVVLATVRPRVVVSAGSAGGLGEGVRVGDVVVGERYVYSAADARAFGYALGQVPGMPETYAADDALVAAVAGAAATAAADLVLRTGTVLSSDTFVDASRVPGLRSAFPEALSTDMESTALAHACFVHRTAFVSVRGISDLCGPAAEGDFLTHVDDAADRSARVVLAALAGAPLPGPALRS
ncbi:5'-methylthioadenosine/S-adenosylhomocysteine nucleosidase [Actinotalea ferrariae]|nr:5'-methylthioadenosine/S-adenosylhomocysteine nucleosidase [Actinotalea ferrariae]